MLNIDGTRIHCNGAAQISQFRGKFTNDFYPRRFALKDCIYGQRLEILSILLHNTINRYSKSGTNYVEYSLGVNDLMNLNVWRHLTTNVFCTEGATEKPKEFEEKPKSKSSKQKQREDRTMITLGTLNKNQPSWRKFTSTYTSRPTNFKYCFLAAFNRTEIKIGKNTYKDAHQAHQYFMKNPKNAEKLYDAFIEEKNDGKDGLFSALFSDNSQGTNKISKRFIF